MTLIELVQHSAARLEEAGVAFGHGTTNAFDEAAWLVLWQLGLPLDDLDGVAGMAISPQQRDSVEELIGERIRTRRPAAYLTREAWLQGLPFYVDERSVVPRSLIAELIADGGIFGESYASCGAVANVLPVDVTVPGCPPPPLEILRGILSAVRRRR